MGHGRPGCLRGAPASGAEVCSARRAVLPLGEEGGPASRSRETKTSAMLPRSALSALLLLVPFRAALLFRAPPLFPRHERRGGLPALGARGGGAAVWLAESRRPAADSSPDGERELPWPAEKGRVSQARIKAGSSGPAECCWMEQRSGRCWARWAAARALVL